MNLHSICAEKRGCTYPCAITEVSRCAFVIKCSCVRIHFSLVIRSEGELLALPPGDRLSRPTNIFLHINIMRSITFFAVVKIGRAIYSFPYFICIVMHGLQVSLQQPHFVPITVNTRGIFKSDQIIPQNVEAISFCKQSIMQTVLV